MVFSSAPVAKGKKRKEGSGFQSGALVGGARSSCSSFAVCGSQLSVYLWLRTWTHYYCSSTRAHAQRGFWNAFKGFPCPQPDAVSCSFWENFGKLAEYELCIASVPALICPLLPPSLCLSTPSRALSEPLCRSMVDKGPLLTSAIIFYLSIGAAIFQVLEEPNWDQAVKQYNAQKDKILEKYPCLSGGDLDIILEVWTSSFRSFILCFTAARK